MPSLRHLDVLCGRVDHKRIELLIELFGSLRLLRRRPWGWCSAAAAAPRARADGADAASTTQEGWGQHGGKSRRSRGWTYGADGVRVRRAESSLLSRSSSGAFCILARSEDVVGALEERPRGSRGGVASKAMDIGWARRLSR